MMEPEFAAHHRGRIGVLLALGVLAAALALVAFVGLGSSPARTQSAGGSPHSSLPALHTVSLAPPQLVVSAPRGRSSRWRVVASVGTAPAAWLSQQPGLTMMRFDQGLVHLDLHAGSTDGGSRGWTYGNRIRSAEAKKLIAGFNGGFKLTYKETGFMANGHVARHLRTGLASIVTYADGTTNIGAWHQGVPSRGEPGVLGAAEPAPARRPRRAPRRTCPRASSNAGVARSAWSPSCLARHSAITSAGSWCGRPASACRPRRSPAR